MKQKDDYISGPHNYWVHFVCGFAFGVFVGGLFARWLVGSVLAIIAGAVVGGLSFGLSCGKWGDRAWKAIFESTWWRAGS